MMTAPRILMVVFLIGLLGLAIPFVMPAHGDALSRLLVLIAVIMLVVIATRGNIGVYDWLIIYMALIPLHAFTIGSESVFLRLTEIAFIPLCAVWWVRRKNEGPRVAQAFPPEYIAAFFFLAASFISVYKAVDPGVSAYRTFVLLYLMFCSYIVWDILAGNAAKIHLVIRAMVLIGAVAGAVGMVQSVIPSFYPFYPRPYLRIAGIGIIRAGAWWADPSYYGLYIGMIIPVTLSMLRSTWFLKDMRLLRYCLWLQLGGLFASGSRASILGVFAAYLFLLWVSRKQKIAVTILVTVSLLIAVAFIGMPYVYNEFPALAAFMFRIPHLQTVMARPELIIGWRLDAWRANIAMFKDNPFLGVGPFMSGHRYQDYYPRDQIYPLKEWLYPHSEYFSLLSERGFVGFILFCGFLVMVLVRAGRVIRSRPAGFRNDVAKGMTAGIVSFLVFSVSGTSIYAIQFWLMVGILLAAATLPDFPESAPQTAGK